MNNRKLKLFSVLCTLTLSTILYAKEKTTIKPFPATKEFQGLHCQVVSQNPMKSSPIANLLLISRLDRDGNPRPNNIKIYFTEKMSSQKAKEIWQQKLFIESKSKAKQSQSDSADLRYEMQKLILASMPPNETYSLSFDANINDNSGHSISGQGTLTKFVGLEAGFVNSETSPVIVSCVDPVGLEK